MEATLLQSTALMNMRCEMCLLPQSSLLPGHGVHINKGPFQEASGEGAHRMQSSRAGCVGWPWVLAVAPGTTIV